MKSDLVNSPDQPTRTILKPWDWRYHIGYDLLLRQKIYGEICQITNGQQRDVLMRVYQWAISFVSVDALLTREAPLDFSEADFLAITSDKAIPISAPDILHYLSIAAARSNQHTDELENALRESAQNHAAAFRNLDLELFSIVFPEEFLRDCLTCTEPLNQFSTPPQEFLSSNDLRLCVQKYISDLNDSFPEKFRGTFQPSALQVEYISANSGYAEYWPAAISANGANRLIVYDNAWTKERFALEGTLRHEVFPGHALYYALLETDPPPIVDHGATILIEGWATFAEWIGNDTEYSRYSRERAKRYIQLLTAQSSAEFLDLFMQAREGTPNPAPLDQQIRQHMQYPGLSLSYILGALWFQTKIGKHDPFTFLEQLIRTGAGDFFALWTIPASISCTEALTPDLR